MFGTLMISQKLCVYRAQHSVHLTLGQRAQSQTLSTRLLYLLGRLRRPRPSAGNANRWQEPCVKTFVRFAKLGCVFNRRLNLQSQGSGF